jgi:Cu(I)/Ag(I) efflux system membrane protein CusA/SilA
MSAAKCWRKNGVEFFIRGVGFIKSAEDLEKVVIRQERARPCSVQRCRDVTLGPDFRRGPWTKPASKPSAVWC